MSLQRTLEQGRAEEAWNQVKAVRDQGKNYAGEYSSVVKGAIAFIQINGLGQTLAFWRAKGFEAGKAKDGKNEYSELFNHVSDWVLPALNKSNAPHLLEWIVTKATSDDYRRATTETIAYLSWIKRFAEAELPKSEK